MSPSRALRSGGPVHVLHIYKTGGTALKAVLGPFADGKRLVLHDHHVRLRDCPRGNPVFFVVRHPVERYVSAFNSRLRMGRPRYDYPWSARERLTFSLFPTPNALAESIGSRNPLRRRLARFGLEGTGHLGRRLSYWIDAAELASRRDDVIVGVTQTLESDLQALCALAGIEVPISLPTDPVAAHATPPGFGRTLSPIGTRNVRDFYAGDIALYEECLRLKHGSRPG